jgi:hypothetical protein
MSFCLILAVCHPGGRILLILDQNSTKGRHCRPIARRMRANLPRFWRPWVCRSSGPLDPAGRFHPRDMSPRQAMARALQPDRWRGLGFFREFTPSELRRLAKSGGLRAYDDGELLATEGTRKQRRILYVVLQGQLQYVKRIRGERVSIVLTLRPGDVGGFLTFFNDDPSPVTVEAWAQPGVRDRAAGIPAPDGGSPGTGGEGHAGPAPGRHRASGRLVGAGGGHLRMDPRAGASPAGAAAHAEGRDRMGRSFRRNAHGAGRQVAADLAAHPLLVVVAVLAIVVYVGARISSPRWAGI